ncbi:MAG: ComEC/Rec2 family competence protein, partial [Deltaproteobacteria bacterium]|nr:ComEC/Rec2 family competence protein [Deltaproteobacteria bacterium]MBW2318764.1 ComEC/Rec2 family competence protein [Deltaproteobacteria bacterium]
MHAGASPQAYARPLIPALLALMCGIVTGLYLPGFPYILPAVLAIFLICAFIVRQKQRVRFLPLVLFLLLGYWSLQASIAPKLPANHVTQYIDDKPWHITGTLKGYPEHFSDRTRFVLQVETLTRNQASRSVTGAVRITVRGHIDRLQTGDRIGCLARLKEIRNFNNPGGFDYRQYMTFKKIWAMAYVSKEELLVKLHTTKTGRFQQIIDRARMAVSELIERAPPSDSRGILKALVIGDRYEISPQNRELFSRIGISHLLAISGLHIGMVATLVFFAFRFLLARSQRILLAAWVPRGTALIAIVPVISYGFLAGMSPSTKRAVIMVTVFLLAIIFEREDDKTNTLALAALVILIITPTALFEISFQLSFTAVFCILYLLNNLALVSRLRSRPSTALKRLGLFMLVSAAAILGTLPITLYYFNQTSLIGVITNCIMVPLVGFIVVPLGL